MIYFLFDTFHDIYTKINQQYTFFFEKIRSYIGSDVK